LCFLSAALVGVSQQQEPAGVPHQLEEFQRGSGSCIKMKQVFHFDAATFIPPVLLTQIMRFSVLVSPL
jgi:hypothetical protein